MTQKRKKILFLIGIQIENNNFKNINNFNKDKKIYLMNQFYSNFFKLLPKIKITI